MHGFYALLSLVVLCNSQLFSMQLTRLVKRTPHTKSLHRNYAAHKPTTISYKGTTFTPAEFASHMTLQAVAKGMNFVRQCADSKVECTCMVPYTCINEEKTEYNNLTLETYNTKVQKLNNAMTYLKGDSAVVQELIEAKNNLCPHANSCVSKIISRKHKWSIFIPFVAGPITAAVTAVGIALDNPPANLSFGLVAAECAGIGTVVGFVSLLLCSMNGGDSQEYTLNEKAIHRYLYEETQKIEKVLAKVEPIILRKAEQRKNTHTERKLLSAPDNDTK